MSGSFPSGGSLESLSPIKAVATVSETATAVPANPRVTLSLNLCEFFANYDCRTKGLLSKPTADAALHQDRLYRIGCEGVSDSIASRCDRRRDTLITEGEGYGFAVGFTVDTPRHIQSNDTMHGYANASSFFQTGL